MKTAKRVLATIVAVVMIIGTCAVAASAETAETLQAKIDNAAAGDVVTMEGNPTASITINKNSTKFTITNNDGCISN